MAIRVLDKQVSELIAAGEVIERPASIVKELMENAIDANATAITVEIKKGGITYIRVTDNGCGIAHSEAPTAFLRHATSKISTESDLTSINTLGFRGEALASVSAVARVELLTKRAEDTFGTRVYIEGSEQKDFSDAGCADGTTIIVTDLFYNVPARLKFMKKDTTEASVVTNIVEQLALSHPEISIKFIRDNKDILHTPGNGKPLSAIYSVLGREYAESLMPAEYEYHNVKVTGFVSQPMHGRKNRTYQHFFVNGRYVKTRVGMLAVEEGYKNSIMIGKFPSCVLQIELPSDMVDVNVHPAKTEIRFTNEREVYDAVYFAVKSAITSHNSIAEIAVKEDAQKQAVAKAMQSNAFMGVEGKQLAIETTSAVTIADNKPMVKKAAPIVEQKNTSRIILEKADEKKVDVIPTNVASSDEITYSTEKQSEEFMFIKSSDLEEKTKPQIIKEPVVQSTEPKIEQEIKTEQAPKTELVEELQKPVNLIGEIFGTYILAQQDNVFMIIDKHAAHERIIFEQLKTKKHNNVQMLLSPITVTLSTESHNAFVENIASVEEMGFEVEDFGGSSLLIRAVPTILEPYDITEIIEEIADSFKNNKRSVTPSVVEDLYHSVACKAAIKANDKNNSMELAEIVNRVCNDESIRYCPHGRPVVITMTEYELKKKFGR